MKEDRQNLFQYVREADTYLRLENRKLDNMQWMGTGPIFRKHHGRVYYHIDELKEWPLEYHAKSTSAYRVIAVAAT